MPVTVLGSINLDIIHRMERLPRPGETVLSLEMQRFLGGKGANQAVAAVRAGAATRLIAAIGADAAGEELLSRLRDEGVDVSAVSVAAGHPTGSAIICVDGDGENMIVVSLGANAQLKPVGGPGPGDVLLAQLETPIGALEAALTMPGMAWSRRILNAAPAVLDARRVFDLIDVLVVNETELAVFAGLSTPPATAARCLDAAARLADESGVDVIVTRGAAGAVALAEGERFAVPGVMVEARDATGAGDCFCGALAARLSAGAELKDAMGFANMAAALSVARPGASASMPTVDEIAAALDAG